MIKRILVTGSSGMIGTRLLECLLSEGYEVVGIDKRPNKWSVHLNNLTIIGDLTNFQSLGQIDGSFDMLVNLAANARVYESVLRPKLAKENMDIMFHTLEFCKIKKIKRFLFVSSREVYGNSLNTHRSEADASIEGCESPYTASKIAGESLVHAYVRCYGLSSLILRLSNVYGMYDISDRVVPQFIMNALRGADLIVHGKDKVLDFTYIDDTVNGITESIKRFDSVNNNVFNLAYGQGVPLTRLADTILNQLSSTSHVVLFPSRLGEVYKFTANISKAREYLGFSPKVDLEEGIKRATSWYQKNLSIR